MSNERPTLIRPELDAAAYYYEERRRSALLNERRQLREAELGRLARRIAAIDLEVALLQQIRTRELAVDLARRGFDTSGLKPMPLPTETERESRRRRGRPDVDPVTLARQEEAATHRRLYRPNLGTVIRVR